jgi:hypothetical protein
MPLKPSLSSRVRKFKVALIEGMFAFGAPEAPNPSTPPDSVSQAEWVLDALDRGKKDPPQPDEAATMPSDATTMLSGESERTAEAVRRALPELVKLDRYERHAIHLRDRSLRAILESKNCSLQPKIVVAALILQNEPNFLLFFQCGRAVVANLHPC